MTALQKYKEECAQLRAKLAAAEAENERLRNAARHHENVGASLAQLLKASPAEYAQLLSQFQSNYPGVL